MQSMQEHDTFPGKIYAVTCASGCTITDNKGRTLGECEAGKQTLVIATSDKLMTSADALVTATFNSAPAKLRLLGLLGGGESAAPDVLPAGYLAAEFLQSSGKEHIETGVIMNNDVGFQVYANALKAHDGYVGGLFPYKVMPLRIIPGISAYYNWGSQGDVLGTPKGEVLPFITSMNYYNDRRAYATSAAYNYEVKLTTYNKTNDELWLFDMNSASKNPWRGAIFWGKFTTGNELVKDFIPCIDLHGVPCMFDKVSKLPFYNSGTGAFIVGVTLAQARELRKLPATGGTLTVSLPTGYESDTGVMTALETARTNGWTLTIQTYTPEAEAGAVATYGMRRIWVRKTQDANGMYMAQDGTRWQVEWCVDMYTPDGSTPDQYGYELYRSVDAAVAYWELTPWVDPEAEELLTNQEL